MPADPAGPDRLGRRVGSTQLPSSTAGRGGPTTAGRMAASAVRRVEQGRLQRAGRIPRGTRRPAYRDACQIISTVDRKRTLGLLPDDAILIAGLAPRGRRLGHARPSGLAERRWRTVRGPRATANSSGDRRKQRGRGRSRTIQFLGTEAAAEAHVAGRSLAAQRSVCPCAWGNIGRLSARRRADLRPAGSPPVSNWPPPRWANRPASRSPAGHVRRNRN